MCAPSSQTEVCVLNSHRGRELFWVPPLLPCHLSTPSTRPSSSLPARMSPTINTDLAAAEEGGRRIPSVDPAAEAPVGRHIPPGREADPAGQGEAREEVGHRQGEDGLDNLPGPAADLEDPGGCTHLLAPEEVPLEPAGEVPGGRTHLLALGEGPRGVPAAVLRAFLQGAEEVRRACRQEGAEVHLSPRAGPAVAGRRTLPVPALGLVLVPEAHRILLVQAPDPVLDPAPEGALDPEGRGERDPSDLHLPGHPEALPAPRDPVDPSRAYRPVPPSEDSESSA
mmetsp:Transcript_54150/g.162139  ORF Transcript_54150/g.162139 Transcript_54150/m.162139 type:complete len:282 (-) Transcript_54150:2729-3574(-)